MSTTGGTGTGTRTVPATAREAESARSVLLGQLARGPRTRAQLAEALRRRSISDRAAIDVLDRFAAAGLIDDRAYADAFVRSEAERGGMARRRLRHRLRDKGVPEDIIEECLDAISADDEERSAMEFAARRADRLAGLDAQTQRRRMVGLLLRRGYDGETVRKVVMRVLQA